MSIFRNEVTRDSLCYTCRHAHIVRGFTESDELVYCNFLYPAQMVPFPVRECTSYSRRNVFDLEDMEEIALEVQPRSGKRPGFIGYVPPIPEKVRDGKDE